MRGLRRRTCYYNDKHCRDRTRHGDVVLRLARQSRARSRDPLYTADGGDHQRFDRNHAPLQVASGEQQEETEWHRVSFFGRLAEIAGEYLRKGRPVYVEGRLRTRKWQDKDGNDKYTTEVVAENMQLLGSREGMGGGAGHGRR